MNGYLAGILTEVSPTEYVFRYDDGYFADSKMPAVSLTLPKTQQEYRSAYLFPFSVICSPRDVTGPCSRACCISTKQIISAFCWRPPGRTLPEPLPLNPYNDGTDYTMPFDIGRRLRYLLSGSYKIPVRWPVGVAVSGLYAHRRRQPQRNSGRIPAQPRAHFPVRRTTEILDGHPWRQAGTDTGGRAGTLYPQTQTERFP